MASPRGQGTDVLEAFMLVTVAMGSCTSALAALREIEGVRHAQAVTGPYDIVIDIEATDVDALGKMVQERIQTVPGVVRTLTCPVFHL